MIKFAFSDQHGNPVIKSLLDDTGNSDEIATLKKRADILEDNGETRPKKAFWKKTDFKT